MWNFLKQDKRPQIKPPPTKQRESSIERRDFTINVYRYRQFWICTTLIFVATSIGTLLTYSSQTEGPGMELWHKSGDLVCRLVLWLCHHCSSLFVCNPQVLLCTIGLCPTTLSLWIFLVCLYSSTGELLLFKFSLFQESMIFFFISKC